MNRRLKGNLDPLESIVGIVLVDSKYFPNIVSNTASLVDRASPEEKAIFARVVSTRELGLSQQLYMCRMLSQLKEAYSA